ncbi:hypothetical protein [Rhodovulum marinum]|uniref:hypothetical protein n=1 Tax=Rhodovulum marinum TaxID=320662 RepID=UPI00104C0FD2|nr:hypothetical protein [Rhodovulum marinum]
MRRAAWNSWWVGYSTPTSAVSRVCRSAAVGSSPSGPIRAIWATASSSGGVRDQVSRIAVEVVVIWVPPMRRTSSSTSGFRRARTSPFISSALEARVASFSYSVSLNALVVIVSSTAWAVASVTPSCGGWGCSGGASSAGSTRGSSRTAAAISGVAARRSGAVRSAASA